MPEGLTVTAHQAGEAGPGRKGRAHQPGLSVTASAGCSTRGRRGCLALADGDQLLLTALLG